MPSPLAPGASPPSPDAGIDFPPANQQEEDDGFHADLHGESVADSLDDDSSAGDYDFYFSLAAAGGAQNAATSHATTFGVQQTAGANASTPGSEILHVPTSNPCYSHTFEMEDVTYTHIYRYCEDAHCPHYFFDGIPQILAEEAPKGFDFC